MVIVCYYIGFILDKYEKIVYNNVKYLRKENVICNRYVTFNE